MLNILYKSIFNPLEVLNMHEEDSKQRKGASFSVVVFTVIFGSVIYPVIYYLINKGRFSINISPLGILLGVFTALFSFAAVCIMFWMLTKAFGKDAGLMQIASVWGLSYIPNLLCWVLYSLIIFFPGINNGGIISAFIISAFFIFFLVWKAIYYFMMLRAVLNANLKEFVIITAVSAAVIIILAIISLKVGIQIPII